MNQITQNSTPQNQPTPQGSDQKPSANSNAVQPPAITLPTGGGAIRGMGEKFAANPVTGTGSMRGQKRDVHKSINYPTKL
jgi:hypothetical protein